MKPARIKLEMLTRYQHVVNINKRLQEIQKMVNGSNVKVVKLVLMSTHVVMVSTQQLAEIS